MGDWTKEQEWLKSLKDGSEVAVYSSGGFYGGYSFTTIERTTEKYFVVGGTRYRKADGREAGDHYRSRLVEPTRELKAAEAEKKRRRILEQKIESVRWHKMPIETLERVAAALESRATNTESAQAQVADGGLK
jgi:hypothetical protein